MLASLKQWWTISAPPLTAPHKKPAGEKPMPAGYKLKTKMVHSVMQKSGNRFFAQITR